MTIHNTLTQPKPTYLSSHKSNWSVFSYNLGNWVLFKHARCRLNCLAEQTKLPSNLLFFEFQQFMIEGTSFQNNNIANFEVQIWLFYNSNKISACIINLTIVNFTEFLKNKNITSFTTEMHFSYTKMSAFM